MNQEIVLGNVWLSSHRVVRSQLHNRDSKRSLPTPPPPGKGEGAWEKAHATFTEEHRIILWRPVSILFSVNEFWKFGKRKTCTPSYCRVLEFNLFGENDIWPFYRPLRLYFQSLLGLLCQTECLGLAVLYCRESNIIFHQSYYLFFLKVWFLVCYSEANVDRGL